MPENRCLDPMCLYPAAEWAARRSVRWIANLASIAGGVVVLTAVSTQAQTLTDALAEAYNTNPQLLAQRALLRATDEQVPQALSFWRPQVTFTGQVGIATGSLEAQPTTAELAAASGIPVVEDLVGLIDLAVDGADEVDPRLNLIKGRGGALFREKLIAAASKRFVAVVDESKVVDRLGEGVLPVEVLPFLWRSTAERLAVLCKGLKVRGGEETPYLTDNGNLVLDVTFDAIPDPAALAARLKAVAGVIEHGLFIGLARSAIVGGPDGVQVLGQALDSAPGPGGGR